MTRSRYRLLAEAVPRRVLRIGGVPPGGNRAPKKIKNISHPGEISNQVGTVNRVAVTVSRVSVVERIVSREYVQTTCP